MVSNAIDIPLSQLPKPCLKGDIVSIRISEDEYRIGLDSSKNCLHGRVIMVKGSQPMKVMELRSKLAGLRKSVDKWRLTPLGKGYFEFCFSIMEDLRRIWSAGSWSLNPGTLILSRWSPDFNPKKIRQSHVQC